MFDVSLIYCFEKPGVLADIENEQSVIGRIILTSYEDLKEKVILPECSQNLTTLCGSGIQVNRVVIGRKQRILYNSLREHRAPV